MNDIIIATENYMDDAGNHGAVAVVYGIQAATRPNLNMSSMTIEQGVMFFSNISNYGYRVAAGDVCSDFV